MWTPNRPGVNRWKLPKRAILEFLALGAGHPGRSHAQRGAPTSSTVSPSHLPDALWRPGVISHFYVFWGSPMPCVSVACRLSLPSSGIVLSNPPTLLTLPTWPSQVTVRANKNTVTSRIITISSTPSQRISAHVGPPHPSFSPASC
jgi:hypothetical protein